MCFAAVFDLLMCHLAEVMLLRLSWLLTASYTPINTGYYSIWILYFAILAIVQSTGSKTGNRLQPDSFFLSETKHLMNSHPARFDENHVCFCLFGFVPMTRLPRISRSLTSDVHCVAPAKQDAMTMGCTGSIPVAT